jgi:membrane protease YdiL (CAAX protease family)
MFCPRCRDEFREGFTRCQECGVELVDGLASSPPARRAEDSTAEEPDDETGIDVDAAVVTVRRYFRPLDAHADRMRLEQAGVEAWVSDEMAGATYGVGIGSGLQVRAPDEAAARGILDAPPDPVETSPEVQDEAPDAAAVAEPAVEPPPALDTPHAAKDQTRAGSALELVAVLLATVAYPIGANLLLVADEGPISAGQLASYIPWYAGVTLVLWRLLARREGLFSPAPPPASASRWLEELLIGVVLFLAVWSFESLVGRLVDALLPPDPSRRVASFQRYVAPGMYAIESLFAAAYEEVVFRAYLISRLASVLGIRGTPAVVLAAAAFALIHGYPLGWTLTVFAVGVFYGALYLASPNLPRLVVAHWLYNLAVMSYYLNKK